MIEVLKQALEALKEYVDVVVSVNDPNDWRTVADGGKPAREAITSLRQAIAGLESQEPVAWMHIMDNTEGIKANGAGIVSITQKRKHPFGKPGIDFSKSYPVTSTPLYTHPPQRTEPELCCQQYETCLEPCTPRGEHLAQRAWVGLTDYEIGVCSTEAAMNRSGMVGGAVTFARAIEAKLKQKNGFTEEKNT